MTRKKIKSNLLNRKSMMGSLMISAALIFSGCQLRVADSTSTPISSTDSAVTTSAAASAPTAPDTAAPPQTSPATTPAPQTQAAPPVSTIATGEDVQTVLQRSANAMLTVESYDYTSTNVANFGGEDVESATAATIFPGNGDGRITTTQGEVRDTTYLKNNRMYMMDPLTEKWVYMDLADESEAEAIVIHDRVNEYMTVTEINGEYVLTSDHPLDALQFYSLTGIEVKQKETLDQMASQGQTMETMVEFILDDQFRYRKVTYEQVTTTAGVSTHNVSSYTYSNYNEAEEIIIPQEILEGAIPFQAQNQ